MNFFGCFFPLSEDWKFQTDTLRDYGTEKIQRSNLDGSDVEDLVTTGLETPDGLALDVAGGKMYWTDWGTNNIQRSNLDGSDVEDLVTTGLVTPRGLALDVAGGKMYWTDEGSSDWEKIQRSNLDGSGVETLISGRGDGDKSLADPNSLALDVAGGKMYWREGWESKVRRSNLDGSGVETLINSGLSAGDWIGQEGLALDVAGGKMYWMDRMDRDAGKVRRSNLDGSGVETLITGLDLPSGLALDVAGGKMYWTELVAGKIQRSNLDGSGVEDLINSGLDRPASLALGLVPIEIEPGPDLVVQALVSDDRLTPGQSFTLSVTVRNRGDEQAAATTLRYYRSDDAIIDASDTPLGTAAVNSLASLAERAYSIDLTAPASTGTYYYGACVESVAGERKTHNNCTGANVTVPVKRKPKPQCYLGMILSGGQSCVTSDGRTLTCPSSSFSCTVF